MDEPKGRINEPLEIVRGSLIKPVDGYYTILYIILSLIQKRLTSNPNLDVNDDNQAKYEINVSDIADEFKFENRKNVYKKLKTIAINVYNNDNLKFETKEVNENGNVVTHLFRTYSQLNYVDNEGKLRITLTPDFHKYAVQAIRRDGFKVFFDRFEVLPMKSDYSRQIFPYLIKDKNLIKFNGPGDLHDKSFSTIMKIDDFREWMHIPESYQTVGIKRICDIIEKDINTYSKYITHVSYNFVSARYSKRKLTHICFLTTQKSENQNEPDDPNRLIEKIADNRDEWLNWLVDYTGLNEKQCSDILADCRKYNRGKDYIKRCWKLSDKTSTNDVVAMMRAFMKKEPSQPKRGSKGSSNNQFLNVERTEMNYEEMARAEEMAKVLNGFE